MLRIVLLSLGAMFLFGSDAKAHEGHGPSCAYGPYHSGTGSHFHPGGYGQAVPCGGRRGYAPSYGGDQYYGEPRRRHRQHDDYIGPYYRPNR